MTSLKDISIEKKLKAVIMLVSGAACAAVCLILIAMTVRFYRQEQLDDIKSLASVLGQNAHAALAFDLPEDAREVLSSVDGTRSIVFSGIYDVNGNLFAYSKEEGFFSPVRPPFHGHEIKDGMLYVYEPISRGDRILGSVCLVDTMYVIRRVTFRTFGLFLVILGLVMAVMYIVASHMQKLVSAPLREFTEKAHMIAVDKDYTVRMKHDRQDELGVLAAAFNIMLSQIEAQREALERANANLEERVKDRTRELKDAHEKLFRTHKLALIGELAGSIAHEIRTPLGVLKNAAYYLKTRLGKMVDDPKIMKHLDIIEDEIDSSDKIITDVLTFARVKQPDLEEEEVNGIVRKALDKVALPENVELKLDLKDALPKVYVDRKQMLRVFCNLIQNAAQSMPEGGEVAIATGTVSHFVTVSVTDTGTGISKENLEKIFDPLFSTKSKGTGLGLSTCRTLLSLHNGKLEVESTVGEGSDFTVKLPFMAFAKKEEEKKDEERDEQ